MVIDCWVLRSRIVSSLSQELIRTYRFGSRSDEKSPVRQPYRSQRTRHDQQPASQESRIPRIFPEEFAAWAPPSRARD